MGTRGGAASPLGASLLVAAVALAACGGGEGDEATGAIDVSWSFRYQAGNAASCSDANIDRVELIADQGPAFDSVATRLDCESYGGETRALPLGTYELKAELWKGGALRGVTPARTVLLEEADVVVELSAYEWTLGTWLACSVTGCIASEKAP